MTSNVLVRRADVGDVPGIQRIAREAWHAAYDDILGADIVDTMLDEWYEDAAIEAGVEHDAQDFFVAERDQQIVGFAHVGPHPPRRVHQLYRLYVHPDDWREGIGRQLLADVEQALYDRDVGRYEAEVIADNDVGVFFYESAGFERVEETDREFDDVSAVQYIFAKQL